MLEEEFATVGWAIAYAIVSAIGYALIGYAKRSDSSEIFEGERMLVTIVVGIIAGFASYWLCLTPEEAVQLILADVGMVYLIENTIKAIWRRYVIPPVDLKNK